MFSFRLSDDFITAYADRPVPWGYTDAGGTSVGEITFLRTYSRLKDDGTKERWHEVCQRVIEGMFSIQKDWCKTHRLPWNDHKAQRSAQDAYERMFVFKWTPPGRGLWMMGSPLVMEQRNSAALQSCAFVSTGDMTKVDPAGPFAFLMEASMLGVGVGFDSKGADKNFAIYGPDETKAWTYRIPDTREGWVQAVVHKLESYLLPGKGSLNYDAQDVRPSGTPIRTFGGTAAGPDPLIKLLVALDRLFAGRDGQLLTVVDIADIGNLIGVCVVSGNVRRSAELFIGSLNDKDFVNLKNADIFPVRNSYDQAAPGWGWMSNNSVAVEVGADFTGIVDAIAHNGEPGVIWLDLSRQYGRLIDPPTNADHRVQGYNPCCLPGDTLIMTVNGPRRIDALTTPFWALVDGQAYQASASWSQGEKDVFTLETVEGYVLSMTEDHKVLTPSGFVQAAELVPGDHIVLSNQRDKPNWGGDGTQGEGYLLGLFRGDGGIEAGNPVVKIWDLDEGSAGCRSAALTAATEVPNRRSDWLGWRTYGRGRGQEVMAIDRRMVNRFGMFSTDKPITQLVEAASADFQRGFLRGFFDADGHVEGWADTAGDKGASVRLSQSDYPALQVVQRMLLRFGIKSRVYLARPAGVRMMPDGRGGRRGYDCRATWRLVISTDDVPVFAEHVGFANTSKADKLAKVLCTRRFKSMPFVATVKALTFVGKQEVFDLTVRDRHAMDANGVIVHNCEQSLESYEMCTLVETFMDRAESVDDFKRTLKVAYLYAKTVTLLPTHWQRTNAIMQRNRRIGASVSGVSNFADTHGMTALRTYLNDGYAAVQHYDHIYSEWLCVRESIKRTTVKPSGTVSIPAGSSPGAHWTPGGEYFDRAIRFSKDDPTVALCRAAGYRVETASENPDTTVVVFFPIHSKARRSERQVSLFEKANLAVLLQRYWSDNSVSVTLSFDAEKEAEHVGTVLHMHDGQLKTVSFLPQGNDTYPQMPYTEISAEEYEAASMSLFKVDLRSVYAGQALDAIGESYCETDACEVKTLIGSQP